MLFLQALEILYCNLKKCCSNIGARQGVAKRCPCAFGVSESPGGMHPKPGTLEPAGTAGFLGSCGTTLNFVLKGGGLGDSFQTCSVTCCSSQP